MSVKTLLRLRGTSSISRCLRLHRRQNRLQPSRIHMREGGCQYGLDDLSRLVIRSSDLQGGLKLGHDTHGRGDVIGRDIGCGRYR